MHFSFGNYPYNSIDHSTYDNNGTYSSTSNNAANNTSGTTHLANNDRSYIQTADDKSNNNIIISSQNSSNAKNTSQNNNSTKNEGNADQNQQNTNGNIFQNISRLLHHVAVEVDDAIDRLVISPLQINDYRYKSTPPASLQAIEQLPRITISQEHIDKKDDCPICKELFSLAETVLQIPCAHRFHPDCIKEWLKIHNSCPLCRYELPTANRKYERYKERVKKEAQVNTDDKKDEIDTGQTNSPDMVSPPPD